MIAVPREMYPLSWPTDYTRTRPQDQRHMGSWKRTANQYREALVKELTRMECPSFVISSNVPLTQRGGLETKGVEPLDVGVAVWFKRKHEEDFRWQDALDIHDPAPTEAQVLEAFRRLAAFHHPDKGGDKEMFLAVTKHRDNALRWINRKTDQNFDYVIASDTFREVRLNMAAIVASIKAIRQLERCGTSSMLERAFKGFAALPAQGQSSVSQM
jgi:hypothetical protein